MQCYLFFLWRAPLTKGNFVGGKEVKIKLMSQPTHILAKKILKKSSVSFALSILQMHITYPNFTKPCLNSSEAFWVGTFEGSVVKSYVIHNFFIMHRTMTDVIILVVILTFYINYGKWWWKYWYSSYYGIHPFKCFNILEGSWSFKVKGK